MHNNAMLQRTRLELNSLSVVSFVYGFAISAQKNQPKLAANGSVNAHFPS
tara:strand:+ start:740 stop:889 length:150 start_codon:yes stop_codon:yes gene_type:complete